MDKNKLGYLLVNVRYARGAVPVMGASAELTLDGRVIGQYMTDIDGKTELIRLEPNDGYYIKVTSPMLEAREYGPIPVINGITTLQNVELFPSVAFGKGEMLSDI